ncbi:DUF6318 family protein [Knoellia locipacati]|uniref:DUF6318 family protein n=1 Tax=Knoellia locipacati TaxID=882824 RepID=UPI00384ED27D
MNKSWGRAVVALSIAAVALSACGDEAEPSAAPTPSSSVTSSGSTSPSPSGSASPTASASASSSAPNASVPAAARARTEAGAIAFLNFYFGQINKGFLDPPNAPELMAYADKDCIACRKTQESITEYARGGWSVKQSPLEVREAALATEVTADRVIINFTSVERAQTQYLRGTATTYKTKASTLKKGAALKWVDGTWQMFGMENL